MSEIKSQDSFSEIAIMASDPLEDYTTYVTAGIGLRYIIKPFMERNGYRDGAGWWVKK